MNEPRIQVTGQRCVLPIMWVAEVYEAEDDESGTGYNLSDMVGGTNV